MCYLPERMTANSNNYDRKVPRGEGEIIISVVVTSTASSVTQGHCPNSWYTLVRQNESETWVCTCFTIFQNLNHKVNLLRGSGYFPSAS